MIAFCISVKKSNFVSAAKMSAPVTLTSLLVDSSHVSGLDLNPKSMEYTEPQIVGHELGPVVTFSDLLQLGADCTVLGNDYISDAGKNHTKKS